MKYLAISFYAFFSLLVIIVAIDIVQTPNTYQEGNEVEIRKLVNQVKSGELTGLALDQKIDFALGSQAERNWNHPHFPRWSPTWGELIETAYSAGLLPAEKWREYASNAVDFAINVSPFLINGNLVPVSLHLSAQLGPSSRFRVEYQVDYYFLQDRQYKLICSSKLTSHEITEGTHRQSSSLNLPLTAENLLSLINEDGHVKSVIHISIYDIKNSGVLLARREIEKWSTVNKLSNMGIKEER